MPDRNTERIETIDPALRRLALEQLWLQLPDRATDAAIVLDLLARNICTWPGGIKPDNENALDEERPPRSRRPYLKLVAITVAVIAACLAFPDNDFFWTRATTRLV